MCLNSFAWISWTRPLAVATVASALLMGVAGCGSNAPPAGVSEETTTAGGSSKESEKVAPTSDAGVPALPPGLPESVTVQNSAPAPAPTAPVDPAEAELPAFAAGEWVSLFDGNTLDGWASTKFGGEGDVMVEEGRLVMTQGNDMTGVTSTRKDIPKSNYEIVCEARRVQGSDFFCGLTFPVKSEPCSLILGGWGGGTCGLSSIDGFDASENSTSSFRDFELNRWYTIKLRVTDAAITAWIDGEQILEQELEGRRISIRAEVDLSRPLGFSTWRTAGELRKVQLRTIAPEKKSAS